jgi:flagellar assembly protein FliH
MKSLSNLIKASFVQYNELDKVSIHVPTAPEITDSTMDEQSLEIMNQNTLLKAEQDAQHLILEAKKRAEFILDEAEKQARFISIEIQEEGRQQGYQKGYSDGIAKAELIEQQVQQTLQDATQQRQKMLNEIEPQMVELVIEICQKILGDTIISSADGILYLIRRGFSQVTGKGKVMLRISEEDFNHVSENKQTVLNMIDGSVDLEIIKDLTLNQGDCIIETPYGNIDCSVDQQFENIKNELKQIVGNG